MRVVTIGGATVDIIVTSLGAAHRPGAKQDVDHIGLYAGGGAVNAGLGFVTCGASVSVACAVGADVEGQLLRATLAQRGIDVAGVEVVPEVPTGKAVVHVGADGEASVFAQRGASTRLSFANGLPGMLDAEMLYVSALAEQTVVKLIGALSALSHRPFKLVFNPGARQLADDRANLTLLLAMADLVCLNAVEAQLLAQVPMPSRTNHLTPAQAQALAPTIAQHPDQAVLITLGVKGAVFFDGQQSYHHPAAKATVMSTLGAGDAFASTFVFHWALGSSPHDALAAATQRATVVLGVAPANLAGPLGRGISHGWFKPC